MSTYEKIHGRSIQAVTTDPSETVAEGQVWYNTASDTFKSIVNLEAFTSSALYTTGRRSFGSSGTQTANLIYAGAEPANSNKTEEYNGSGWASGGAFGASGYGVRGMGTQTAALSAGLFTPGGVQTNVYEYDGSSWTAGGSLPAARAVMGTAGTQTAGLAFGGSTGPFVNTINSTYEYDGSSWTGGNNLNTGRTYLGGFGTQTAAAGCGGYTGSPNNDTTTGATEEYDGTNWTTSGSMNTARRAFGASGIQTAGLVIGGTTGSDSSATEKYNGSTWATSPATLGTATRNNGGSPAGTQSAAISTEGGSSPYGAKTEEFNSSINVITAAAWASAATANTARGTLGGTGPSTSALVFGGAGPSRSTATEEYNGSSWSTGGALPTATTGMGPARNASQTAALGAGGYDGAKTGASYTYDGSSWTGIPNLGTPRQLYMVGGGTSTSALVFGGDTYPPAPTRNSTATEEWNGSSWTAGGSFVGAGGYSGAGTGPQTAAVSMGRPSSGNATLTENYNGTSWTSSATIPMTKSAHSASGTQTAALMFGGTPAPLSQSTLSYDGSVYSTAPSTVVSKYNAGGGGTSSASFMSHGRTPPAAFVATTEEFTAETSALNVKTLTQS